MFKSLLSVTALVFILAGLFTVSARSLPVPENPKTKPVEKEISLTHKHTSDCEKTPAEPVQIICILDRSGSMQSLTEDTIGGYNSFLAKQKQNPGQAEVTTILFDDEYEIISESVDINQAKDLTDSEYFARGTTALLDAVGKTITNTLGKMEKEKICPEKRRVLIMIMTDGLENSSIEYDKAAVKKLISLTTEKYKWNYLFIGANMDSVSEAKNLGIQAKHAANYSHDSGGVQKSFSMMDAAASEVREKGTVGESWKK